MKETLQYTYDPPRPYAEHTPISEPGQSATCTETGLTEGSKCSACGKILIIQEFTPASGHSFTNYISDENAKCTQDGTKTAKCERCDVTETIPDNGSALGHDLAPATCTEPATCRRSGCAYTEGSPLGHSPGDWVITEYPCTHKGLQVKYCMVCGKELETQILRVTGHDLEWEIVQEASATDKGLRIKHCAICGKHFGNAVPYKLPK